MRVFHSSVLFLFVASASAGDLAVSMGWGAKSVQSGAQRVSVSSRSAVLVNAGGNFFNIGAAAIGWEAPLAFGGPQRAAVFGSGNQAIVSADSMNFAFTPGIRLRVLPVSPLTPWVSIGAGGARVNQATAGTGATAAVNASTGFRFASSVAGGIDCKPLPALLLRAELRNFRYSLPNVPDASRNTLLFLAGVGIRF